MAVTATTDRLTLEQRREFARALTDAVLVPEVGQPSKAARVLLSVKEVPLRTSLDDDAAPLVPEPTGVPAGKREPESSRS